MVAPRDTPASHSRRNTAAVGRDLARSELLRRGLEVQAGSGDPSTWRLTGATGATYELRVKAAGAGAWQYSVDKFLRINFDEGTGIQTFAGLQPLDDPELLHLFVSIGEPPAAPRFFLLTLRELQEVVRQDYTVFLQRHRGRRPQQPRSLHVAVRPRQLEAYENRWLVIGAAGAGAQIK